MLSFASQAYIFFPGGYGTLDELFEMLTLVQTEKIPRIPIVLVNKKFWSPLIAWMEDCLRVEYGVIDAGDLGLYYIADTAEEAHRCIGQALKKNN